jgi:hypothetical protein
MFCRKIGNSLFKGHMGVAAVKQGQQLFTDDVI